jgi:AraC-like DNA-binding protein
MRERESVADPEYRLEHVSTSAVETKADRTDLWSEYLRTRQGSFGLAFSGDDFNSEALAQKVGQFQIVEFESDPIDYERSPRDVRGDGDNSYRLFVPLKGDCKVAQGDSAAIFSRGEVGFFHWGTPLHFRHEETIRALIVTVPERSIDVGRARDAPIVLDEGRPLVRLLTRQVRQLAASREDWTAADYTTAFSSALTLLDGALAPAQDLPPQKHAKTAERARLFMELYAGDPKVTPEAIAKMCHCSLKTLHTALKETEGLTPGVMLRGMRLERARQRLSTPLPVDMDRIAFEAGFTTTRRFRESFQRQFGQTPAQLREELFGVGTKE